MALTLDDAGVIVSCAACGKANRVAFERIGDTARCGQCKADLTPPAAPADVRSAAQFDALVSRASVPVLVDFWAPWCGPCRMVAPEVEKVAATLRGRLLTVKVNTDEQPELAQRFGVRSIPTLAVFSNGQLVERVAGALPAANIVQLVEKAYQRL
jgi:thioredoxin 2